MKILLATDGSPSAKAAEELVATTEWPDGTQVEVLCVDQLVEDEIGLSFDRFAAAHAAVRREMDDRLASLLERLGGEGRTVRARVVFGRPASTIVAEATKLGSDLVVVGSHGRGALASLALGSVAAEVADHAPCPVLVARRPTIGPIVLGHDGSAAALLAEGLVTKWPFLARRPVRVVSASPLLPPWYMTVEAGMNPGINGELLQELLDERHASSKRIAAASVTRLLEAGLRASADVRDGSPADALLDAIAEMHAGLVVVGSRGNTGVARLLLGSVARSVLHRAPCSVLIVREKTAAEHKPAPELTPTAAVAN